MANTLQSIDFKGLSQQLYLHLQSDAIAFEMLAETDNPSESVKCLLEDDVLRVLIYLVATPTLETSAIFSCAREFLEQVGILNRYEVKIHLIVDEQNSLKPSNSMLLAPLHADFPKQSLSATAENLLIQKDWTKVNNDQTFSLRSFWTDNNRRFLLPSIAMGLSILLLGGYALSRPCVIGSCPALNQAEQLTKTALISLNVDQVMDWLTMKQQLKQAIQLLEPIPPWSAFHGQATQLMADYAIRLQTLEVLSQAVRQVQQAQALIEQTSLSIREGSQAVALLEAAITTFHSIANENSYAPFTQKQLRSAQEKLLTAQQRLLGEQQAEDRFNRATENAVLARIRSSNPQSLADLNLIAATWKTVIQNLQQIAPSTTVYDRAKKQLSAYSQAYQTIEMRKRQEQVAQLNYQEAKAIAEVAQKANLDHQWSVAVSQWQKAIAVLKSVPAKSFMAEKSKILLTSYNLSLQEAENNLKTVLQSQTIKQQLESLCSQWIRACDYSIGSNIIKVRLTPAYVKQIWDSALQAKAQGNVVSQTGILNHISHLEQTLQMISNQSGLPLELYHAKGNRLSRYQPNT